jgi:uncharacterized protein YdhG (YjbR/CyaY superfamily)
MNEVIHYVQNFDSNIQERLNQLREVFFETLPNVEESIRYKMPSFKVGKDYLYFAAYKKHIGFYPVYGMPDIENEYLPFRAKGTKDSLHFKHDQPLPLDLVRKIILLKAE